MTVNVNCPCSIWSTGVTPLPEQADGQDGSPAELGVKFRSDKYGTITALRFYKAAANTGTHTGSIWSADGQLLAQATFQSETATGWQTVTFSNPVTVEPNTTYVASYFAPQRPLLDHARLLPAQSRARARTAARSRAARRSARSRTPA